MALAAKVASLEEVPEAFRGEYKKVGEQYQIDVTSIEGLELADVGKLRRGLERERELHSTTKQMLAKFDDLDPEAARVAVDKLEKLNGDLSKDDKFAAALESRTKEIADKADKKVKSAEKIAAARLEAIKAEKVTAVAIKAIERAGGNVTLLLPHVEKALRVKETEDFKYLTQIIGENGQERVGMDSAPMTVDQLIEEFKGNDVFGTAFAASGNSGSGSGGGDNKPRPPKDGRKVKTVPASNTAGVSIDDIADGIVDVTSN